MAESNQPVPNTPTAHEDDSAYQLHLGYDRVEAELTALSASDLEPINLDIAGVVQTVLGTVPEILTLRSALAQMGALDMRAVDHLRDYALALGHTHTRFRIATGTQDTTLVKELFATRERFHADAQVLVLRGILDPQRVAAPKSGNNHQWLAYDVIGLAELFLATWDEFGSRSLLEKTEIEQARLLANRLLSALGAKEQGPSANAEVSLLRRGGCRPLHALALRRPR